MTDKPWNKMNADERREFAQKREAARAAESGVTHAVVDPDVSTGTIVDPAPEDNEPEGGVPVGEPQEPYVGGHEAAALDRRERLLQGIDPSVADLISDEELDEIEAEERAAAEATRKERALKDVRASLRQRARIENDLISADTLRTQAERKRLAEEVTFRVNLPGSGAGHAAQHGFRVDGVVYQDGFVYTRPRAVYESLLGMHYRAHRNEIEFRTLDQQKPGMSAIEVLQSHLPQFEVIRAA